MQFLSVATDIEGKLRVIFGFFCKIIYSLIAWLYDLFITISKVSILTDSDIKPIYQRVTMILTIIMVFYVTFELIKYIVQPDEITSKDKGIGNIIYKMFAVVVLIAMVPNVFTWAYKLQNAIIDQQVLTKVILGKVDVDATSYGRSFSSHLLGMFYYFVPNEWGKLDEELCGGKKGTSAPTCKNIVDSNYDALNNEGSLPYFTEGLMAYGTTKNSKIANSNAEKAKINFSALPATIVGVFVVYVLVLYCIDAGTRYAQLIYLQVIAPIPIIGYLSPKKDGIFQKWVKQCTTTFLDLFIRISIIYFVLLVCEILGQSYENGALFASIDNVSEKTRIATYIALIMGLLLFAQKAPKMLEEIFPKMGAASGNFGLKAGERVAPLAARVIGAGLGAKRFFGGALIRGINTAKRNRANGQKSIFTKEGREQFRQRHRNRGAYLQQRNARREAQVALWGHENDEARQQAFKTAKTKELEAKNAMAVDENKKYRGVLGNALAGGLGGAYRGVSSGIQATKLEDVVKKAKEGRKNDKEELASREKWLDSGGTGTLDRTAARIEKEIGISSAPERTAARIKVIDDQIKGNEAMIKIESAGKGAVSKGEDVGKDKLATGDLKGNIYPTKTLSYKDSTGTKHTIDTTGKTTLSDVYKDFAGAALTAKSTAEAYAKKKSDKELEQLEERADAMATGNTKKIEELDKALKPLSDEAAAKAKEATDAENARIQVQKVLAREAYSQILEGIEAEKTDPTKRPESREEFKGVGTMIDEIRTALETVKVAASNSKTVEAMRSLIGDSTDPSKITQEQFDAFMGNAPFTNYDDIDAVTKKLGNIASDRTRENQGYSEEKRKIESSDVYVAEKANAENSGGKK